MSTYRLLAIDVDGTLVNSRDELSDSTRDAIIRARSAGIHVVLATGRRYSRTLHLVEPLGIDVPLITASGALIKDPADHRTLHVAQLAREVTRRVLEVIVDASFDPVVCCDTFADGFDYYVARDEVECPHLGEYIATNRGSERIYPEMVSNPPSGVFTGFAMGTREEMLQLDALLNEELPGELYTHVLRSPRYTGFMCEFAVAGATKWTGIRRLAGRWGIEDSEICAVGDDVNDVPMIRAAGLGVAMGNGVPEVKQVADRIAPSQQDDGLVEVVRWLLDEASDN